MNRVISEASPLPWVGGRGRTDGREPWDLGWVLVPESKVIRREGEALVVNPKDCIFAEHDEGWDSPGIAPKKADAELIVRAVAQYDMTRRADVIPVVRKTHESLITQRDQLATLVARLRIYINHNRGHPEIKGMPCAVCITIDDAKALLSEIYLKESKRDSRSE